MAFHLQEIQTPEVALHYHLYFQMINVFLLLISAVRYLECFTFLQQGSFLLLGDSTNTTPWLSQFQCTRSIYRIYSDC